MQRTMTEHSADVAITMKNGTRKYGIVIGRDSNSEIPHWKFVSNNHIKDFGQTKQVDLIEEIPEYMVAYIDQYLK